MAGLTQRRRNKLDEWRAYLEAKEEDLRKQERDLEEAKPDECPTLDEYLAEWGRVNPERRVLDKLLTKLRDFQTTEPPADSVWTWRRMHQDFVEKEVKHLLAYVRRQPLDRDDRKEVEREIKKILDRSREFLKKRKAPSKVQRVIENYFENPSRLRLADLLMNPEFVITYVLKLTCLPASVLAGYFASRTFKNYYARKFPNPPRLFLLYLLFFGFMIFFEAVVLAIVAGISFLGPTRSYVWTAQSMMAALQDIGICLFAHSAILAIVTWIFERKKYFRYRVTGFNTIDGLMRIGYLSSIVIYVLPFFLVLW